MGSLTALSVKAATQPGKYHDGDGLILLVKPTGARSWVLRLQADGRRREYGLGAVGDVSLAEAREKAGAVRKQLRAGIDPIAAKRAERLARRETPIFSVAAETVHEEHKATWRNKKHRDQWINTLRTYAFPTLGPVRIDQIDAAMVRATLLPIWLDKPETARRVRQRICAVLDWAHANGFRPAEAPIRAIGKGLPRQPKRDRHFAAMPFADVPAFAQGMEAESPVAGRLALLMSVYTAARSGEVRGATWSEFDLKGAVWTIPAGRMKAGREHVIPLSPAAVAVLEKAKALRKADRPDAIVFPGRTGQPLSDMTLSKMLRDSGESVTVHGFRSAFKDWASETTGFPDAVSEAALAHGDPDKTRASYRRTDFLALRRDLMNAWGNFLAEKPANVVRLADRAGASAA